MAEHVVVGTGTRGTRYVRSEYPVTEGLTAGTTKLRKKHILEPEQASLVSNKDKIGVE